jgi:hypothetical protein
VRLYLILDLIFAVIDVSKPIANTDLSPRSADMAKGQDLRVIKG